jgi:hypothetical protein
MKIIDKISGSYNLIESPQGKKEIRFAVINYKTGETITPFCKCKDYFTDMFWSKKLKKKVAIYGFHWDGDKDNKVLDEDTFSIAINLTDKDTREKLSVNKEYCKTIKSLLNQFEKKLKFDLAETQLDDENLHIIVTVSKEWSERPYLVSSLFFLIRLGFTYDGKTNPIEFFTNAKSSNYMAPYDEGYFRTGKKKLEDLLKGIIDKKQKYEMYTTSSEIHGSSGLIGYQSYSV